MRPGPSWYEAIFEQADDAFFVSDAEGRYLDANPAACALLGYTREELCALNVRDLIPAADLAETPPRVREVATGAHVRRRRRLRHKSGALVSVELRASPIDGGRVLSIVRDVSADVARERELREHEATLHELTTHLPALTWIRDGRTGAVQYASAGWERYLGRPVEIGGHFSQLMGAVHPDDRAQLVRSEGSDAPEEVQAHLVRFLRPDGGIAYKELRAFPVRGPDGEIARVCGIAVDVTALRAAEEARVASEQKYATLFERAPVGLFRSRLDGSEVLEVNEHFCRMFKGRREDFVGTAGMDWWADSDERAALVADLRAKGAVESREFTVRARDGTLIRALGSATAYPALGTLEGSVIDISEISRAHAAVRDALAEKEVLLAEIHHRVKNNLQVVSSLLHLQASRVDEPRYAAMYRTTQTRIAAMSLVHQMLYESSDLARIRLEHYVAALARAILESHGNLVGKRLAFDVQVQENVALPLDAAVPFGLLLHELLTNAVKHAFPDPREGHVRVSLRAVGPGRCRLVVEDDGVGLPDDVAEREQAGLGNKLVSRLAQQLRGALRRESTPSGTRYEIELPCVVS